MGKAIPASRLGLSAEDVVQLGRRRGRYGNVTKPVIDGKRFDSAHEADRYLLLKAAEEQGHITDLELQPRIKIVIGGVPIKLRSKAYPNGRQLTYVGDFRYVDVATGSTVLEDAKMSSGHRDRVYTLKKALVEAMGLTITEV